MKLIFQLVLLLLLAAKESFARKFDVFLRYRLDLLAEMSLTQRFKREFFKTLVNYENSKEGSQAVISMPNCSKAAVRIGSVNIASSEEYNKFIKLMDDLTKRVYRTGFNLETISGNFRLPISGLDIDEESQLIYTRFDGSFPTDSFKRYITFLKSFYVRLCNSGLEYSVSGDLHIDRLVLGRVLDKKAIDLTKFRSHFKTFSLGFSILEHLIVRPACKNEPSNELESSVFYFDLPDHEPLIGAKNQVVLDDDDETASNEQ